MNRPPAVSTPIPPDYLQPFVQTVLQAAGMPVDQAELLAGLLTTNDLRGVFSHGTRQTAAYVDHFRAGRVNPHPTLSVVEESPTTLLVDGDGGLGYFPAYLAAQRLGSKAREMGLAAALTRNHGHIGAAGIYARIPLEHDLFCYVTSGHQLDLHPGQTVLAAAGGSPHAFALPTDEEPPFVLDFGAMHDMYPGSPHADALIELAPGSVFRSIGLGAVCQALGGFLAGVPVDPARAERVWSGANQGSFMIAVDLARFGSLDAFKREMDEYSRKVRTMAPLAGFDRAVLPGGMEHLREQQYRAEGIPLSPEHVAILRQLATDYDVEPVV